MITNYMKKTDTQLRLCLNVKGFRFELVDIKMIRDCVADIYL